jgi:tetratricopeptide (TPR) repeat protein
MGIVGRFRYILVTPALLNSLDDDEMEGVILHEIGHVAYHHMLFYLMFFAGFIACNFVFFEPLFLLLYVAQPLYGAMESIGVSMGTAHAMLLCAGLICLFLIYFRLIFGFFMRNFERQADLHVFNYQPGPSALISTFYKIAALSRQPIDKPNWHHYGIGERIRFLEQCREAPQLIARHHFRVKKLIFAYILIATAVFSLGYSISYGKLNLPFGQYIAGKILTRELALDPGNSDLYVMVGDYYYNDNLYAKARDAYENVLRIDPHNIHALNNLAWLLSTCPDASFREPERALEMAVRAVAINTDSFVLDTYAEALFMNGRRAEALDAARRALDAAVDRVAYYQGQVQRVESDL